MRKIKICFKQSDTVYILIDVKMPKMLTFNIYEQGKFHGEDVFSMNKIKTTLQNIKIYCDISSKDRIYSKLITSLYYVLYCRKSVTVFK